VALVFGRERVGLTNDELQKCHYHVAIAANPEYSSLNLAMAVQVIAYEVRMAWLAVVVSHKVNGVSELHSRLMVESLFAEFAKIFPMRFINVTNGVTPRRWLALANPPLSKVLDEHIGRTWRTDLSQLDELKQHIDYPMVNQAVRQAKFENKQRLASYIAQQLNVVVNPKALFDVQIKRIHEYKRQLMNVLHVITRYNRIKADPQ
ncbi:glycogen/starch/alpha-glucan phosphorylase, partial [Pseudomonas aeruginosa]|nr:glycogen/starch/alpha-glucan phosphorylase [Pseudomonas aeruginosa]